MNKRSTRMLSHVKKSTHKKMIDVMNKKDVKFAKFFVNMVIADEVLETAPERWLLASESTVSVNYSNKLYDELESKAKDLGVYKHVYFDAIVNQYCNNYYKSLGDGDEI